MSSYWQLKTLIDSHFNRVMEPFITHGNCARRQGLSSICQMCPFLMNTPPGPPRSRHHGCRVTLLRSTWWRFRRGWFRGPLWPRRRSVGLYRNMEGLPWTASRSSCQCEASIIKERSNLDAQGGTLEGILLWTILG